MHLSVVLSVTLKPSARPTVSVYLDQATGLTLFTLPCSCPFIWVSRFFIFPEGTLSSITRSTRTFLNGFKYKVSNRNVF